MAHFDVIEDMDREIVGRLYTSGKYRGKILLRDIPDKYKEEFMEFITRLYNSYSNERRSK